MFRGLRGAQTSGMRRRHARDRTRPLDDDAVAIPGASAAAPRGGASVLRHRLEAGGGAVRRRRTALLAVHVALVPLIYLAAFALRFDGEIEARDPALHTRRCRGPRWSGGDAVSGPAAQRPLALHGAERIARARRGRDRGHAAVHHAADLSGLPAGYPRSVLILDWLLDTRSRTVALGRRCAARARCVASPGTAARPTRARAGHRRDGGEPAPTNSAPRTGTLIAPVGLLTEDPAQVGRHVCGVPVLGTAEDLRTLATRHRVRDAYHSSRRSPHPGQERGIPADRARVLGGRPRLQRRAAAAGRCWPDASRRIAGCTWRGRRTDAVQLDMEEVRRRIEGRTVLITGGAGSIGSGARAPHCDARAVSAGSSWSTRRRAGCTSRRSKLAQAQPVAGPGGRGRERRDRRPARPGFRSAPPDFVLPCGGLQARPADGDEHRRKRSGTTCSATLNAARCAAAVRKRSLFLPHSTDKAVRPSSIMGATKRDRRAPDPRPALPSPVPTRITARSASGTSHGFGLTACCRCSAAARGGRPLPVTDPAVTRYFMTTTEAVQLVLRASTLPEAASASACSRWGAARILDLAEGLVRLSGLRAVPAMCRSSSPACGRARSWHEELTSLLEQTVPSSVERIRIVQGGRSRRR